MAAPHATALRRRGLPGQFSSTARDRKGRGGEGMFGAGGPVKSAKWRVGEASGGVAGAGSSSGGLALHNEEGVVILVR